MGVEIWGEGVGVYGIGVSVRVSECEPWYHVEWLEKVSGDGIGLVRRWWLSCVRCCCYYCYLWKRLL